MSASPVASERRKTASTPMTDAQFKYWTIQSMEEGTKRFETIDQKVGNIDSKVELLTSHVTTLTGHIETLTSALSENTELTKKTAVLAQKTADDTADLVRISQFGKKVSRWGRFTAVAIAFVTRTASRLSKLLIPILIVGAIASALWHGETIRWKDILEAIK